MRALCWMLPKQRKRKPRCDSLFCHYVSDCFAIMLLFSMSLLSLLLLVLVAVSVDADVKLKNNCF